MRARQNRWPSGSFQSILRLLFDHLPDPLKRPVDLSTRDDQRRGNADHVVVGLFAENAQFLQRLAVRPGRNVQLDADPEAFAADFAQARTAESLQLAEEVTAQLSGAPDQVLFDHDAQRSARD